MKQVNKQRATLIYNEYKNGECSTLVSDVMRRFLKNFPSIIEEGVCKRKGCASRSFNHNVPVLEINETEFNGNMANLEKAVMTNFPTENLCQKCRQKYHRFERTCGDHLFIEVGSHVEVTSLWKWLNHFI